MLVWILFGLAGLTGDAGASTAPVRVANVPRGEEVRAIPFATPDPQRLQQARTGLRQAADQLEGFLDRNGERGRDWKQFLQWHRLRGQLDADPERLDPHELHSVQYRLLSGHDGLDHEHFAALRRALAHHRAVDSAANEPKIAEQFEQQREELAQALDEYHQTNGNMDLTRISLPVAWMQRHDQASELVSRIHQEFNQPNVYLSASADILIGDLSKTINESQPVNTNILGTAISGREHTVGSVDFVLRPDQQEAALEVQVSAVSNANTVGRNGPVRIVGESTTQLSARQRILINDTGVHPQPVTADANTNSQVVGLSSTIGFPVGGIVRHVARHQIARKRGLANAIAEEKSRRKLREQLESQTAQWQQKVNAYLDDNLRRPLATRDALPDHFALSTTKENLTMEATVATAHQLGSGSLPPSVPTGIDFCVRLEESACDNMTATFLAGQTVPLSEFVDLVEQQIGPLPDLVRAIDLTITFDRRHPIVFEFANNEMVITIRCTQFHLAGNPLPGADISARHRIETTPEGIRAVRLGDISFAPHLLPGASPIRVNVEEVAKVLRGPFEEILRPELDIGQTPFAEKLSPLQSLKLTEGSADSGWLSLGWTKEQTPPAAAANP